MSIQGVDVDPDSALAFERNWHIDRIQPINLRANDFVNNCHTSGMEVRPLAKEASISAYGFYFCSIKFGYALFSLGCWNRCNNSLCATRVWEFHLINI